MQDVQFNFTLKVQVLEQFFEFAEMADEVGIPRNQGYKTFLRTIRSKRRKPWTHTIINCYKDVVKEGLKKGISFLMETDYLDDKTRPGAVFGPKTVPRRTKELINLGILNEDDAYKIHVDNVEKIYGVDLGV